MPSTAELNDVISSESLLTTSQPETITTPLRRSRSASAKGSPIITTEQPSQTNENDSNCETVELTSLMICWVKSLRALCIKPLRNLHLDSKMIGDTIRRLGTIIQPPLSLSHRLFPLPFQHRPPPFLHPQVSPFARQCSNVQSTPLTDRPCLHLFCLLHLSEPSHRPILLTSPSLSHIKPHLATHQL